MSEQDQVYYTIRKLLEDTKYERISWWNIAVSAFSHRFDVSVATAAESLSPCWDTDDLKPSKQRDKPSAIANRLDKLYNDQQLTWWNIVVMAYARDHDLDAIQASVTISECWPSDDSDEDYYHGEEEEENDYDTIIDDLY